MNNFRTTATALAALFAASPALADLTAEDVLADQLGMVEMSGLTADVENREKSGDTLTTGDLIATGEIEGETFSVQMPGITLVEQGDGTVRLEYPSGEDIVINGTSPEGDFSVSMTLTHEGMDILVSGTPDAMRYDYDIPQVSVNNVRFDVPGEDMPEDFNIEMVFANLVGFGEFGTPGDAGRPYTADFDIGSIGIDMNVSDPEEGSFDLDVAVADMALDYSGSVAQSDLMASFAESIQAGNITKGTITHGELTYELSANAPEGATNAAFAAESGSLEFSLDEAGLDYGGTTNGMTIAMQVPQFPLPISIGVGETGGRFKMPLIPSEEVQTFALSTFFRDLVIDDTLWGMFDPAGQLPRDPATLVVDIEGQGVLAEDVFDPDYAGTATGAPGSLEAISINEIALSLLGAQLMGDGNFTFDNSGGMPNPSGQITMTLEGGNTLLDTLVNMGLLPQEQAMGARMMLGLFARPGDGPDTLVSTIEVREGGSVFANGQQIR